MKPLFKRAVVAGVGLIGGSLAIAGKQSGVFEHVTGYGRSKQNLETALRLGLVDEITDDLGRAAEGADFFFAAVPVESIVDVCQSAARHVAPGCVMTDGGSVKTEIVRTLDSSLPDHVRFVGGHPVAGTEKSGAGSAFAELFKNRYVILTPSEKTDKDAIAQVENVWKSVGADTVCMSTKVHDQALSYISHLPHLAAYALVDCVTEADEKESIKRFVAGGFKDTTRIAASNPRMWRDIFGMNKEPLLASLDQFRNKLMEYEALIAKGDLDKLEETLGAIKSARLRMEDHCD